MMTQRRCGAAEEVPGEGLVDDGDFVRGCCSGSGEVTAGDERDAKRLEIAVAHPRKLNSEIFIGFGRVASDDHIAVLIVANEIAVPGCADSPHAWECGDCVKNPLLDGRDLSGRIAREFWSELKCE